MTNEQLDAAGKQGVDAVAYNEQLRQAILEPGGGLKTLRILATRPSMMSLALR